MALGFHHVERSSLDNVKRGIRCNVSNRIFERILDMQERVFLFDVDGTLTPARQAMNSEFEQWFYDFAEAYPVYLVSGSDRPKTIEQVGQRIYDRCLGVYQCNGNEHWFQNARVKNNPWQPSYDLIHFLENEVKHSPYHLKVGNHIERRAGMVNFSTIGRDCNQPQRGAYYAWDNQNFERERIKNAINKKYPELHASIGGHISIDIYPRGNDKSQVSNDLRKEYKEIIFFGDRTQHGGNDYPVALAIRLGNLGTVHSVESAQDTWDILKRYNNGEI